MIHALFCHTAIRSLPCESPMLEVRMLFVWFCYFESKQNGNNGRCRLLNNFTINGACGIISETDIISRTKKGCVYNYWNSNRISNDRRSHFTPHICDSLQHSDNQTRGTKVNKIHVQLYDVGLQSYFYLLHFQLRK